MKSLSAGEVGEKPLRKSTPIHAAKELFKMQGVRGFYKGLDAAVLR
jgi:hypothetical protein